MDSLKFQDIRVEKAKAIAKHRRVHRITTLFRMAEVFVLVIVVSRFTTNFAFSNYFSTEYFRGIWTVNLISPRSVFVVGNVIVVVLFLISGQISSKKGDLYDEYVEKCRNNTQTWCIEEKRASDEKVLSRTHSVNLQRAVHVRPLRRSMSDKCRKKGAVLPGGGAPRAEEEMSSEQFRQTVEAFIARQKCCLREEEEEFSA